MRVQYYVEYTHWYIEIAYSLPPVKGHNNDIVIVLFKPKVKVTRVQCGSYF